MPTGSEFQSEVSGADSDPRERARESNEDAIYASSAVKRVAVLHEIRRSSHRCRLRVFHAARATGFA